VDRVGAWGTVSHVLMGKEFNLTKDILMRYDSDVVEVVRVLAMIQAIAGAKW